jgi:hypothetical protein
MRKLLIINHLHNSLILCTLMENTFSTEDWVAYLRLFVKPNEIIRFENEEKARIIYENLDKKLKKAYKLDKNLIYRKR